MPTATISTTALRGQLRPPLGEWTRIPEGGTSRGTFGSVFWAVVVTTIALSAVAFGGPVPAYIYGIDDDSTVYEMDLVLKTSGSVAQAGITSPANGLAYDRTRDILFVAASNGDLFWWKQGGANFSLLASGASYTPAQPFNAAFYADAYWFFEGTTNELRKLPITFSGGVPSGVSPVQAFLAGDVPTPNTGGDIAITPTGTLYSYTASGAGGRFYSLDLNTIGSGTVGGYTPISITTGTGLQIAFNSDYSVLYGHNYDDGKWYTIDTALGTLTPVLTESGTFTTVTGTNNFGFRDIGGAAVQAVPEPGGFALIAMASGPLVWWLARRRRGNP